MLAISRCFAGSMAANPRLEPPLLFVAIVILLLPNGTRKNAGNLRQFTMLIEVNERPFKFL